MLLFFKLLPFFVQVKVELLFWESGADENLPQQWQKLVQVFVLQIDREASVEAVEGAIDGYSSEIKKIG